MGVRLLLLFPALLLLVGCLATHEERVRIRRDPDIVEKEEFEVIGKGNKKRLVYLNERTKYWLRQYIARRKDDREALFVSNRNSTERLAGRSMQQEFAKVIENSGIQKRVTLHTLRHTYGTNLLRNGCPVDYIARLMGHSKPETTRIYYLSVTQKDAGNAQHKYLNYQT